MGLLDDLGKKVTDAGQKTLQKTKDMSDTMKINSLISEEEKRISTIYHQIGKLYVERYGNECVEEFRELVETVSKSKEKVKEYRTQIQDIKGVQRCEKCGAEVPRGSMFCSSCGAEMIRVQPESTEKKIQCKNCGAMVKEGINFCTECGAKIEKEEV